MAEDTGEACGAQDRAVVPGPDGEDEHPTCTLPTGHPGRFHQEWRDGELWAEWSGRLDVDPTRAVDGERLPDEALRRMDRATGWSDIIAGDIKRGAIQRKKWDMEHGG